MFGTNQIVGKRHFRDAPKDSLFVTSMFFTLQGEGPFAGQPAYFIRLAKCNLACKFCFAPSTEIRMGDGTIKAIADIVVGDEVVSWNSEGFSKNKVTKLYKREVKDIYKLVLGNRKIWTTEEHPFLTSNRGWVKAKDLTRGDVVVQWTNRDHATMFNSAHRGRTTTPIRESARAKSAKRLSDLWKDPEFRASQVERMHKSNPMKNPETAIKGYLSREKREKTGLEKKFEKICNGLPITYIGDGSGAIVAHKIPDFVVNNTNKIIEVWAADAKWSEYRDQQWIDRRKSLFNKHGFEVLMLPLKQSDLKMDNHEKIHERVVQFIHNGAEFKSFTKVDPRAIARIYGKRNSSIDVYNIEVENDHTYVANGLVVHNCDTFFDDGEWLTFDQIEERIETDLKKYYGNVLPAWLKSDDRYSIGLVMTGGEPMLQDNIGPWLKRQESRWKWTQIESNGTVNTVIPATTTLIVSPKCSEQTGKYLAPRKEVLERANALKFVVSADPSSPYHSVPDWAHEWKRTTYNPVFISPMNIYNEVPMASKKLRLSTNRTTIEQRSTVDEVISFWTPGLLDQAANQANHEYAARYALGHGLRLNLQMHLYCSLA